MRAEVKLNGVDLPPKVERAQPRDNRTAVLFVGKLEYEKGCDPFMMAFLRALKRAPGTLHAIVVGTGACAEAMRAMVAQRDAGGSVTFLERVPHAEILDIQRQADIYVSLNRLGNFSNANLEAMRMGACMIMPAHLPEVGAEDPTDGLLPPDAYARISGPDAVEELADKLLELHRNPALRKQMSAQMKSVADRLLPTWQQRVEWEIGTLFALARKSVSWRRSETAGA